ncbi:MAG: hypothetical protein M1838_003647 [Thelocarpon superellum]|nr:MAG: hypothetical protein M1838_003647 [Thelocarpon superellum]
MPIRNPFRRAGVNPGVDTLTDEHGRSSSHDGSEHGSDRIPVGGPSPLAALNIKGRRTDSNEYKLSVVNDSGVYLPPSPPEKQSFWNLSNASTTSSNHRSLLSENEPFSISRESFESYRRSFDISARSPVCRPEPPSRRTSLDSRGARLPRSALAPRSFDSEPPTEEEGFEDVMLNDETKPKRKSIFSRFGDSSDTTTTTPPNSSTHHVFHLPGRKRGHSGQGAELGKIDRPVSAGAQEVKVET